MSNQRPASLTPSKIPTPTKRVPKLGADDKVCGICQGKLSHQDRNYRLITTDFAERIALVVCSNLLPSQFICTQCITELKRIEKMTAAREKFI